MTDNISDLAEDDILNKKMPYSYKIRYFEDFDEEEDLYSLKKRPTIKTYMDSLKNSIKVLRKELSNTNEILRKYESLFYDHVGISFNDLCECYDFLEKNKNIKFLQVSNKHNSQITITIPPNRI
jgi:hypothetical protein